MRVRELDAPYHKLLDLLLNVFNEAVTFARDGASFPDLDRLVRARITEGGYPGQPSHADLSRRGRAGA